jgi:EAL domain-containing protein (putative c-di-GMP-specific phosphodiesterase class I)
VPDHHGHVFEGVLARCGLTPDRIVLELADDGFGEVSRLAVAIAEYRERGYRVAIDNFGRHSADLDRLEALAPDIVKLDRCLIGHFGHLSLAKRVMTELAAEAPSPRPAARHPVHRKPLQLQVAREAGADWLQGICWAARPSPACRPPARRPQAARARGGLTCRRPGSWPARAGRGARRRAGGCRRR